MSRRSLRLRCRLVATIIIGALVVGISSARRCKEHLGRGDKPAGGAWSKCFGTRHLASKLVDPLLFSLPRSSVAFGWSPFDDDVTFAMAYRVRADIDQTMIGGAHNSYRAICRVHRCWLLSRDGGAQRLNTGTLRRWARNPGRAGARVGYTMYLNFRPLLSRVSLSSTILHPPHSLRSSVKLTQPRWHKTMRIRPLSKLVAHAIPREMES